MAIGSPAKTSPETVERPPAWLKRSVSAALGACPQARRRPSYALGRDRNRPYRDAEGGHERRGSGLAPREAHGLAGRWYAWFVTRHEDEPEGVGIIERLEVARSQGFRSEDAEEETDAQRRLSEA